MVRLMFAQVSQRISTGRNRHCYRAECPGTGDVFRGVTDYKNILLGEPSIKGGLRASLGNRAEVISIGVIVSKSAKTESVPNTMSCQFDLSAATDVAGQQPDGLPILSQHIEKRDHARQNCSRQRG